MKKRKIAGILFICLLLLTGCQNREEEIKEPDEIQNSTEAGENDQTEEDVTDDATDEPEQVPPQESAAEDVSYPRELTDVELENFTLWINQGDHYGNYGFLLSEYTKPEDVNLNEVFYAGAGLETESLSEEEETSYLAMTGMEEIYTDVTRLTTEQIQEFVLRKTGVSYDEMTCPLDWIYLEEFDIYVNQHGDTNYMNFTCVSGRQTDSDTYELDCVPGDGEDSLDSFFYSPSCLIVRENGTDYQFVSNIYAEKNQ